MFSLYDASNQLNLSLFMRINEHSISWMLIFTEMYTLLFGVLCTLQDNS